MSKPRILIVEDDYDISNMLRIFLERQNYTVDVAPRGSDALEKTRRDMPHLIVLDIMLPDIDGYEICRILRTTTRTSNIPIIFLTHKDERSDKLQGLELGADDYITKPFDIDELKLRIQNAIARSERERLNDTRTNLPSGRLIEEKLRQIIRQDGWGLMDIRLNNFEPFKESYGFIAGDDVLRFTAMLLGEVVDELGSNDDFIGHVSGDNFIVITSEENVVAISQHLKERFASEILAHYSFTDRQQGYLLVGNESATRKKSPLMSMAIGIVTPSQYHFTDIREISGLAAEARRSDNG